MTHLGAAVHALEDSYSEAHAWRGVAANHGDPTAPLESLNVFNPLPSPHQHTWGVLGTEGTHDARFDHVPVGEQGELIRGTDIAAAHAVAQALGTFHDLQRTNDADARAAAHAKVGEFYKPSDSGVKVNDVFTDSWAQGRDHRLEYHHNEVIEYDHVHGTDHFGKIPVLEDIPVIGPIIHTSLGHHAHAALDPGPGAAYDPGQGPAYDPGHSAAFQSTAYDPGQSAAYDPGHSTAYDPGHSAAYNPGHSVVYDPGHSAAYDPAHSAAYDPSHSAAYDPAHSAAYDPSHSAAYDPGHGAAHDPDHSAAYDNAHAHATGNEAAHGAEIAGHAGGNEIV